jgi:NodT family efflux transporter outer membrane factor (OMF) lipoprotein
MSWQVDVFGTIRMKVKAQKESFAASREEYNATMVSLCAEVASAYFNLREMQQELDVLRRNAVSQEVVVKITEVRYNTGLVSKLDVAQAKSVYYSTLASIPSTEASVIQYINALAVLLGLYPQDVADALSHPRPLPDYMEPIGVGVPGMLLLRRPDVRAAERQVHAQAALLGATKLDWLPTFFLNGSIGYASNELRDFTKRNSMMWSIAPSISWSLFNGGKSLNEERLQRAQLDETINQFNLTVLTAVQEVGNAMSAYRNSIKQIVACREMLNQGKEAFNLSIDLYKQGLTPFQNVLDAQRSLLTYENALVKAKGYSLVCLVQMYQALGGGW